MRTALIYAFVLLAGAAINRGVFTPDMPWGDFIAASVIGTVLGYVVVLCFRRMLRTKG